MVWLDSTGFYWGCPNAGCAQGYAVGSHDKEIVAIWCHELGRHGQVWSFSLFARGACGEDSPLHKVADLIEPQLEEIRLNEINMRASARPTKSQQMLQNNGVHTYYWASQLTRAPCTCRSFFGADKHMKHAPTCSSNWNAGDRFAKLWDATLLKNFETFQNRNLRPIWLDKSWQALWNWNDHNQGHGIDVHADVCSTYSRLDPITSLSFGRGGVLTLGTSKGKAPTKMLFQEDGDVLIMAGDFQSEFVHGVPPRSSWSQLKNLPMFTGMKEWEKVGLDREIHMHETAVPGAQHVRMNCTIRWHDTHTHTWMPDACWSRDHRCQRDSTGLYWSCPDVWWLWWPLGRAWTVADECFWCIYRQVCWYQDAGHDWGWPWTVSWKRRWGRRLAWHRSDSVGMPWSVCATKWVVSISFT